MFIIKSIECDDPEAEDKTYSLKLINPWANYQTKKLEGSDFWPLTFRQFIDQFNNLVIIKEFPKTWRGYRLVNNLCPSLGGPEGNSWLSVQQIVFDIVGDKNSLTRVSHHLLF